MKILLTGNQGYIGSVLSNILASEYDVVGYDVGYFKDCNLLQTIELTKQISKDTRDISLDDLRDIDVIIHLAALSNDPLGELNSNLTKEINFEATKKIADLAKKADVKRFIYVSSQSMYVISNTNYELDEYKSEKKPVTEYAKTKWDAEEYLNSLNNKDFTIVSFRPSTVFGVSPRLRCDIVFNNLLACAYTTKKIEIKSDGTPWRPVIHIRDVASALIAGIKAPKELISGKSYNIGIKNGNYQIKDMANVVKKLLPNCDIVYTREHLKDPRSYKVSFDRIFNDLGKFYKPEWDLEKGGRELLEFFETINFNINDFKGSKTNRLISIKERINKDFDKNLRYFK